MTDTYRTITEPNKGELFKDRNSKFYGFAFPITDEDDVKIHLEQLKKEHHNAGHWCYAYQLGTEKIVFRVNDDGEPNNSAGMPIYGQIQSFNLTNVLVVVIRYYGGVKLGVSGLINAYRKGAELVLNTSLIEEKTINRNFQLRFDYKHLSKVLRILKENDVEVVKRILEMDCLLELSVRKSNYQLVVDLFRDFYGVNVIEL
ncbi:IMPACT family protein [Winogradskyella poriferorum]|uniref:IMPACT family protein n=1 Tax=Winogradskyella poriferorum TaxID=307627 RepID=UPI003D6617F5